MAVPGAGRIVCGWEFSGVPWAEQVFHIGLTSAGTVDQSTADAIATAWGQVHALVHAPNTGELDVLYSTPWSSPTVRVQDIRVDGLDEFTALVPGITFLSGDPMPPGTALAMNLRTGPGIPNGRTFMPLWGEQANGTDGRPSPAAEVRPIAALEYWRTELQNITGINWLGVVNRQRNGVELDPPEINEVVQVRRTASSASRGWQRQDKRKDGIRVV